MIIGDCIAEMEKLEAKSVDFVLADPPYSTFPLINDAIREARRISKKGAAFFMYAEDLCRLDQQPDQVLFWVKPVSTKNTSRRYSRFVEVIALYGTSFVEDSLHWSNRTGVFTDQLVKPPAHPFGKPDMLIVRLLMNHVERGGHVFDPFAGSGTTERVAERLGMKCTSVEIDGKWLEVSERLAEEFRKDSIWYKEESNAGSSE